MDTDQTIEQNVVNVGGASMQFFVRDLTGNTLTFDYKSTLTIGQIKEQIFEKQGIPVDQQRIVFGGKQLEDNRTLDEYEISDKSTLHLVLRLR